MTGVLLLCRGMRALEFFWPMVVHQPRDADNAVSRHTSPNNAKTQSALALRKYADQIVVFDRRLYEFKPLNDPFEFINEGEGISFDLAICCS